MNESTERLTALARETREAVHSAAGRLEPDLRARIDAYVCGGDAELDPVIKTLVDQVMQEPANADLQPLLEGDFSDDDVFELVLVAATAEGIRRLEAGLAAADASREDGA